MARLLLTSLLVLSALVHAPALAAEPIFDKPLFLMVFDKTCHAWCEKVRPVVRQLKEEYSDKIDFAELDITQEVLPESKKIAMQLGVIKLVPDFGDQVPCVAACGRQRTKIIKEIAGPKPEQVYRDLINLAIAKQ